jgi:hypothetical protein
MKPAFSYHHLHYFWIVAKEGSRAAPRGWGSRCRP